MTTKYILAKDINGNQFGALPFSEYADNFPINNSVYKQYIIPDYSETYVAIISYTPGDFDRATSNVWVTNNTLGLDATLTNPMNVVVNKGDLLEFIGVRSTDYDINVQISLYPLDETKVDPEDFLPPVVSGITPSLGPDLGGTPVLITGSNFNGVENVKFGDNLSLSYSVSNDHELTALSPPGGAGEVDITVKTLYGISDISPNDKFTYIYIPKPIISSIYPDIATSSGGVPIVITGEYFVNVVGVRIAPVGGTTSYAVSFTVLSDTQIGIITLPGSIGTYYNIIVTTQAGDSNITSEDRFVMLYEPTHHIPIISSVVPNFGLETGGDSFVITGSYFNSGAGGAVSSVRFGWLTNAASYHIDSDTQITAISPAGTGTVDVILSANLGYTSIISANTKFDYIP